MQQQRYAVVVDAMHHDWYGRMRRLRESLEEWQRLGVAASRRGDLASLADAVNAEAALFREQARVMDELRGDLLRPAGRA